LLKTLSRDDLVVDWTVLHPDSRDRFSKADDGAVVLRTDMKGTRILLLSDLGQGGQAALLKRTQDLRAEIVVAGLPAAEQPLCDALVEAIQPRLIIISDSEVPVSERANPKLRNRLARKQIPTIYTRDAGAVTFEFRKNRWKLRTISGIEIDSTESAPQIWQRIKSLPQDCQEVGG
jgi:competence protein ComEC